MRETKVGLARSNVLLIHLVRDGRKSRPGYALLSECWKRNRHAGGVRTRDAEREAAKHVESFGVDLWIRVQFSAPPPIKQWSGISGQGSARPKKLSADFADSTD